MDITQTEKELIESVEELERMSAITRQQIQILTTRLTALESKMQQSPTDTMSPAAEGAKSLGTNMRNIGQILNN
jgi:hypothetical protein